MAPREAIPAPHVEFRQVAQPGNLFPVRLHHYWLADQERIKNRDSFFSFWGDCDSEYLDKKQLVQLEETASLFCQSSRSGLDNYIPPSSPPTTAAFQNLSSTASPPKSTNDTLQPGFSNQNKNNFQHLSYEQRKVLMRNRTDQFSDMGSVVMELKRNDKVNNLSQSPVSGQENDSDLHCLSEDIDSVDPTSFSNIDSQPIVPLDSGLDITVPAPDSVSSTFSPEQVPNAAVCVQDSPASYANSMQPNDSDHNYALPSNFPSDVPLTDITGSQTGTTDKEYPTLTKALHSQPHHFSTKTKLTSGFPPYVTLFGSRDAPISGLVLCRRPAAVEIL